MSKAMEYRIRCEAHSHTFDVLTLPLARRRADELDREYGDRGHRLLKGSRWAECVPWILEEREIGRSRWQEVER